MTKLIHNWLQVNQNSYATLNDLIARELFIPTRKDLCGPRGEQTYVLQSNAPIHAHSDDLLCIADQELQAQLNHQPTHAYRAMVTASTTYEQYQGGDQLLQTLRSPDKNWEVRRFARQLENTVQQGKRLDQRPKLVTVPKTYSALWLPRQTYLRRTPQNHWMMALSYHANHIPQQQAREKVTVGLDLGLDPVTVAVTSAGTEQVFRPTALPHLREMESVALSIEARNLLDNLIYASGRLDTEKVIAWLNFHANRVFAERLTHRKMDKEFIFRARTMAIHDHHYSSLSTYLYASQVRFKRVSARHTSRLCPQCREVDGVQILGVRTGDKFHCPRCGYAGNSHRVGAQNVLLNGLEEIS